MKKAFILFFVLISANTIFACSCIGTNESFKEKVKNEYINSDFIFTGKLISKKEYRTSDVYLSSADIIAYTFRITRVIKGKKKHKLIVIKSNRDSSSCGFTFHLKQNYLIYSNYHGVDQKNISQTDLFTTICHRTRLLKEVKKKELKLLRRFSKKNA